jgi:hypothetical protein
MACTGARTTGTRLALPGAMLRLEYRVGGEQPPP